MKATFTAAVMAWMVFFASEVNGDDKAIVQDRIKIIAPLIDEQTIFVAHVDFQRVSLEPLLEKGGQIGLFDADKISEMKEQSNAVRQQLIAAGAKEAYAFYSLTGGLERARPVVAIPLDQASDEKAIRRIAGSLAAERRGSILLLAPDRDTLRRLEGATPDVRPELTAALEAVGDTAVQIFVLPPKHYRRVLEEAFGDLPAEAGGGPITVLSRGIFWAAIGIDPPPHAAVKIIIQSENAKAAEDLHAKLIDLLRLGFESAGLKQIGNFAEVAKSLIPRVEGSRLVIALDDKTPGIDAILAAIARPVQTMQRQSTTERSINNLKQIALAMHNYLSVHKSFPLPASVGPQGKPLLSWRVAILPYIEQDALYQQFHLDEPWDGPHNRALIDKMPEIYRLPSSNIKETGRTNYLLPVGHGAAFSTDKSTKISDITDGTSNTIMVVEGDDDHASIWTKPEDWQFDPEHPAVGLGRFHDGDCAAAFCDGSVRLLPRTIDLKTLKALFTKAGGEPVGGF